MIRLLLKQIEYSGGEMMLYHKNIENKLVGHYLETYEEIKGLCHNLSFFMNDDGYYQITILDETLDLLLEAQSHHQPVEYVIGDNLQKFMSLRYKECSQYQFSYGLMGIIFCILFFGLDYLFPNAFLYPYMETKYFIFLLLPLITKLLYLLNQNICLKMFFQIKKSIRETFSYILFTSESLLLVGIMVYELYHMQTNMIIYNILFFFVIIYIIYSRRKNQDGGLLEWIKRISQMNTIYTIFVMEIIILLICFVWISRYISPLITTGTFQWFIPILCLVCLTILPLRGLNKAKIHYNMSQELLLDQYLSHCQFLMTRRKLTNDILLTRKEYFIKLQKKHHLYKILYPVIILLLLLLSFIMFMTSFQLSVFYIVIIGYTIYGVYNLYKYACIMYKIDNICDMANEYI